MKSVETGEHVNANPYDLPVWKHPRDYMGYSPDGDYVLYAQTRDSSIIEQSNFDVFRSELDTIETQLDNPTDDAWVYTFSASHFLCGWVEYLVVSACAPVEVQRVAYECLAALENYPILDEEDVSRREYEAVCDQWERMSLADRIEACSDADVSIFAARRDDIPERVYDRLRDALYYN